MLVPFINLFILLRNHSSECELCVFDILHSLCYFFRLELKVLNTLIGSSLFYVKLSELPEANSEQGPVEEKYLSKPIDSGVKCALLRNRLDCILLFLLTLTLFLSRILDEGI